MRGTPILLAVLVWAAPAAAETYHVASSGNDSAAGTEAAPWRTLQHAADTVAPGDIVRVRAGEYAGFNLATSGRAGAEIAFLADANVRVTSVAPGRDEGINLEGASYVRVEGFFVTGAPYAGIRAVLCERVTLRGNHVDANGVFGVLTGFCDDLLIEGNEASRSAEQHGIYVSNSGDRPIVRGNVMWGNHLAGLHMNGDVNEQPGDGVISDALVENNVIYGNGEGGASGINCDGVQGSVFRNNLLYDNHAAGISLYRIDGGEPSTGNLVVNNTISMASDGRWAINVQDASSGNTFRNNILLHASASRGAFEMCAACVAGSRSDHNVGATRFSLDEQVIDLATWRSRTSLDADFVAATPTALFSGAGSRAADFVPSASSPAVDRGSATDAPGADLAGNGRPQGGGVDVGALERCDGTCTPPVGGGGDPGGGDPGGGTTDPDPSDPDPGDPDPGDPGADPGDSLDGQVSGGCDAGGGAGSSALLAALLLIAAAARGRRSAAGAPSRRGARTRARPAPRR